jgi:hypothetical protein
MTDESGSKLSVSRTVGDLVSVNRSNRVAFNEGANDAPRRHYHQAGECQSGDHLVPHLINPEFLHRPTQPAISFRFWLATALFMAIFMVIT